MADLVRTQLRQELMESDVEMAAEPPLDKTTLVALIFDPASAAKPALRLTKVVNEKRKAFNAMGQTSMAQIVFSLAAQASKGGYPRAESDAAAYRLIANSMVRTVLIPIPAGGLASTHPCGPEQRPCTWYHSVTRQDRDSDEGATLNQMLHVLRDLGLIHDVHERLGWAPEFDYEAAIDAGLRQLFVDQGHQARDDEPNLADFLSKPRNATGSWAFYGFSPSRGSGRGGYFLENANKNCNYHFHVLDLLRAILGREEKLGKPAFAGIYDCGSPIQAFYAMGRKAFEANGNEPQIPQPQGARVACADRALSHFREDRAFYESRIPKSCAK
jgi:hypothetical protein